MCPVSKTLIIISCFYFFENVTDFWNMPIYTLFVKSIKKHNTIMQLCIGKD